MILLLQFLLGVFIGWVLYEILGDLFTEPGFIFGMVMAITVCFILFQLGLSTADDGAARLTELASELK